MPTGMVKGSLITYIPAGIITEVKDGAVFKAVWMAIESLVIPSPFAPNHLTFIEVVIIRLIHFPSAVTNILPLLSALTESDGS